MIQRLKANPNVTLADYPQLRLIAWHITGVDEIPARQAFTLYETNWSYVSVNQLSQKEITLVRRLALEYGNGVFAPRGGQPIMLDGVHYV